MKFAHIADVHIGAWRDPKLRDLGVEAFIKSIHSCIQEKVDFILIAGDLFNTALPGIDHVKTTIKTLKKAKDSKIPVYFIAGSHDFSPSGKTMLDIVEEAGLGTNVMRGKIEDENLALEFTTDEKTGAKITGIIGRRGTLERKYYEQLDKKSLEQEKGFKIFMFHTSIDELKPEHLKEMESSPASFLPRGFDYYAGGHVHIVKKKDLEGYKNLIYPGPTFPASFSELEKLGHGGFYIYEDGNISRKEIKIKETTCKTINLDDKTAEQSKKILDESLLDFDAKDKIVLIRIEGNLKSGKPSDLELNKIVTKLYEKGAYIVMKNSVKLSSREFSETETEHANSDELEEKIIASHLNQIANDFRDEKETTKKLIHAFSLEKHEGEKNSDYEERIKKEAEASIKD